MTAPKRKGIWIALIAALVVVTLVFLSVWDMFSTQLKAVGTIEKVEEHLYAMEYRGDYGFDAFLARGGAATDGGNGELHCLPSVPRLLKAGYRIRAGDCIFGCSTITVTNSAGDMLFGRSFDWTDCACIQPPKRVDLLQCRLTP